MFEQHDAHVVVSVESHEHHVVGRDERRDDAEYGEADDARPPHGAGLLEAYRCVDGDVAFEREGEDETRREVGEEVEDVLQEHAHELAPVDHVDRSVDEIHAAQSGEDLREEDADEVQRIRHGEHQEIYVRRRLPTRTRAEHGDVQGVADQTDRDE